MRVVALLYSDPAHLQPIAEASLQWTPQAAVSREAVFLEISRCGKLYREQTLLSWLQALNKRLGFKPKIAVANDLPTALAMARFRLSQRGLLPVEALSDYFSPWKPAAGVVRMIELLKKLGVLRVEEFLKLPPQTLSSRFGKEGIMLVRKIREAGKMVWPYFVLPEIVQEKRAFEAQEPLAALEPLLFAARPLIDRAMARLKGRGEKASAVEFVIEQEPWSTVKEPKRSFLIHLSVPQGKTSGFLPILKDRLESDLAKKPLIAPVISISFKIPESVPAKEAERDFFNKKEEEAEAWGSLVSRLAQKFGREKVFIAASIKRHLPEESWTRTLDPPAEEAPHPLPPRPLRLFNPPMEIIFREKRIVAGKQRWELLDMEGPERISGEWWFELFERDYFKVCCRSGEELWIFKKPGSKRYYLHGIFD